MPCSWTPGSRGCQASGQATYVLASQCCLPPPQRRRPPNDGYFGAESHSLLTRCLRFAATVARAIFSTTTQDSLPAGGPALAGRRLSSASGFRYEVSVRHQLCHSILLIQALLGAMGRKPQVRGRSDRSPEGAKHFTELCRPFRAQHLVASHLGLRPRLLACCALSGRRKRRS